jgi:DNA-binding response OmpR family regulator/two-component sensor histidine kinase
MTTETQTPPQAATAQPAAASGRTPRVLLVEDNRDILRATQRILASQKYEILTAMDGEQALSVARSEPPDLILLDVMLPRLDGLEVCRRLKSDPATSGIMIILVTGRGSIDNRVEGFEAGADDYVPKPFHLPELLARVRSALRIKRLTDDLAERNRQLLKSQKDLIQTEKMATIGLLASGIAHEFNNIMAGISGYAQLARRDPKYRDMLIDVALTQTDRALELTRSLSTYNRASTDRAECDAVKVTESALCLVAKELERTGVRVEKEIACAPRVTMSPGQLQEVILNLVLNGIQAIEHDHGVIRVRIRPSHDPDRVEIEVADNGKGIPEENQGRIFDPFFTTKGALGGGQQSGTGLGLTVCYNIIHSHSGKIEVASRVGEGTTFTVTIPRAAASDAAAEAPDRKLLPAVEKPERPLRILLLDDEEPVRELLRSYLKDHHTVSCASGRAALEAIERETFDFAILDVCIQGSINGFQVFERLSRLEPKPRVIFASGRFPDETYRAYIDRAHGHLLKPFKFEALAALLGLPAEAPAASR